VWMLLYVVMHVGNEKDLVVDI